MEMKVIESALVRPAQETPKMRLWISSLDLLVPKVHVSTVYFYENCNGCPSFFEAKALKDGLGKALVPFYPVAGRLELDQDGRVEINCNAEGALFIHAHSNFTLLDFGDLSNSSYLNQLIPFIDRSGGISSYPLLALQVTRLKCGGVCLGFGFHHTVCDGSGAIHFINSLSKIVQGASISTIPASIDRTLLRARVPPTPIFHHKEYIPSPNTNKQNCTETNTSVTATPSVVRLTTDQLNTLKAKAKASFTTYEVLAAHIWRCLCKSRNLNGDQATTLYIPTDGRSRLCPPLPPSYLGNVLFTNTLTLSAGDVESQPLAVTASMIHESVMQMSDEYLRSALDYLEVQPDLAALERGANTFASPNVNVISWMRMPVYDADFGWGRPIYMGPTTVAFEGNIYIVPSPNKGGGLSLLLNLEPHQMELFKKHLNEF